MPIAQATRLRKIAYYGHEGVFWHTWQDDRLRFVVGIDLHIDAWLNNIVGLL